ncbi:MAG TPA: hypothetical protein DCL80_07740 [Balneola sp.]|jgi:macrodomain Ter protein organizer (MatP/YcbG family)|nr:hypothetical protein [Balneola sp.]|tara:strand:- start:173 stop:481 length:309 start_codon:yes stop_codon:yes gene_type:complete
MFDIFENYKQQVRFYSNAVFWPEGKTMDTTKFKSVTIGIETWKKLNTKANKDMRSITRTIEYLVHHHDFITRKYEEGEKDLTPEKYFNMNPPLKRGRRRAHG